MAKFKVGDKVQIVDKWNDGCNQNQSGRMDKWLGKVMTIREITTDCGKLAYFMEEDFGENWGFGWKWNDACIVGLANKFNVGERYEVGAFGTELGNKIKITNVDCSRVYYETIEAVDGHKVSDNFHEDSAFADKLIHITVDEEKIIVTRKGNKTYAKYYINDECKEEVVARCHPIDEYNFKEGAKIALNRLFDVPEDSFPWDEFIDGKVHAKVNYQTIDKFLKDCDYHELKWNEDTKATSFNPYDTFKELSEEPIVAFFVEIIKSAGCAVTRDSDVFISVEDGFLKFGTHKQSEDVKVVEII